MTNIRKAFCLCLLALICIFSNGVLAAIMLPARVSGASPEAAEHAERMHLLFMGLPWVIWIVVFLIVVISSVVKGRRK